MNRWTNEHEKILYDNINKLTNSELARLVGRTNQQVAKKLSRLKLKRDWWIINPDHAGERWKPYPNDIRYLVSNYGRIRGIDRRILTPSLSKSGYYYIDLGSNSALAHRMIAITWIDNTDPEKTEVNHKLGRKDVFLPCQLEWVTPQENMQHSVRHGLHVAQHGVFNGNSKLSIKQVEYIRNNPALSSRKLGRMFGVDKATILNVRNNKTYIK